MRLFSAATIVVLGWGALAFGGEYAWAYAPLLVGCTTVGLLGLVAPAAGHPPPRAISAALGVVLVSGTLQIVPLPQGVLASISPARHAQDYEALFATTMPQPEATARTERSRTLSVRASRTVLGLVFLAAFSVFFLGCARALSIVGAAGIARGLIALGLVVALVGIIQRSSASTLVYGFWYPPKNMVPFAPFVNTNHFAGWMVMALSLSVGYLCGGVAHGMRHVKQDWRNRLLWLSSRDASQLVLAGFIVTVMALALVLSLSRSGITCLVLALCMSSWWAVRKQAAGFRRVLVPTSLALVLVVAVGWGGVDAVGKEFSSASWSDVGGRLPIWRDTIQIIQDFPLTGTGLNTYGIAMLGYQTYLPELRWVEAHNDYLQLAAEGGVLLGLPIVVAIFFFVREVRRRFREGADDRTTYWFRVGAVTGLMAIALQELVDFSLQMPGNAALFAVLAAIAVHRLPSRPARERPVLRTTDVPRPLWH